MNMLLVIVFEYIWRKWLLVKNRWWL